MQPAVLRALEFDRIREALASRALTALGRARLSSLEPATDPAVVASALALTSEAVEFERRGNSLGLSAPDDLEGILAQLDVEAEPLEPLALLGLSRLLGSIESVAAASERSGGPGLAAIGRRAASFTTEIQAVTRAIEPTGEISDRASPALREIRDSLRRQRASLRTTLDNLAKGRDTTKYVQDQIVTDRNGRYVLVVRAEHRDAIPGLVHGSSTSGASLYLEPLATVSMNNEIVALGEREKAEIYRILSALTTAFRARWAELDATLDVAAEFDELFAKADFARRVDGVAPALSPEGRISFKNARHPLLIPAIRDLTEHAGARNHSAQPVASDLLIEPPTRALVISGPNTGGKTVALKAFGLLALMAQAGLLIPVEAGSSFTPFRTVFADIGDEQSIAASLSTFSAHIARIVYVERTLELPALVLFDEVGSGTDPAEGSALGTAIIDHFKRRGALVVATTHDEALKSYSATTDGVMTAGFGFHPDTYAPTYRLLYGAPGRSLAFEIALRLGLPADVIDDARRRRSGRESLLAAHLARMDQELAQLAAERERLASDRDLVASEQRKLIEREGRLVEREAVLKKRLDDRLNEKLREARSEVDRIVGVLKTRAESLAEEAERRATAGARLSTGEVGNLRRDAREALGAVGTTLGAAPSAEPAGLLTGPPEVGDRVWITTFGSEGIVRHVSGKQVEVDVKGKRLRAKISDLRSAETGRRAADEQGARKAGPAGPGDRRAGPTSDLVRPARDLVLVGSTVDEAVARASKFLDDALLADERTVRIVHGHGTGRLREALGAYLKDHPLVSHVSVAGERDGGRAAMIVELKD
jgi:DNA mismatch repair protein MutS2